MTRVMLICLLTLATACALLAADVTGKWKGPMSGGEQDAAFQLKSDGSKVTGTMTGPDGKEHPVTAGSLEGDKIALTIASEWEGSPVTLKVAGTVAGDMMKVTIQTEGGEWSTEATLKKQ